MLHAGDTSKTRAMGALASRDDFNLCLLQGPMSRALHQLLEQEPP